jgi:hypothetical protein
MILGSIFDIPHIDSIYFDYELGSMSYPELGPGSSLGSVISIRLLY